MLIHVGNISFLLETNESWFAYRSNESTLALYEYVDKIEDLHFRTL